jgi:hypothetical protein
LAVELYINGTGYSIATPNINDGNWHHFAVVRSGSNWSVYIDGTSYSGVATNTTLTLLTNSLLVGIRYDAFSGTPTFNTNESFSGTITEFRLYRSALIAGQITTLANGGDLALYSNSLVRNSYHYNSANSTSPTIASLTNSVFQLSYVGSGGITVGGTLETRKQYFYIGGLSSPITIAGTAIIGRLTYRYVPKRTGVFDSVFVSSSAIGRVTRIYNASGTVFTTDPLVPQLSAALVRRGQKLSSSGGITINGEALCNFSPFIKIDFTWHTSVEQIIKRDFLWNTGKLRKFYYRVVSKCLDSCPPVDVSCSVNITTIILATSVSDLCEKLRKKLKFPILTVERLSRPAETAALAEDAALGITHECTTFEPVEVCSNLLCAEFCLSLDETTYAEISTDLALISYYKYIGDKQNGIFISGVAPTTYYYVPPPQNVFSWYVEPSTSLVNVSGEAITKTSGYSAFSFLSYISTGGIEVSGLSEQISSDYGFIGGIASYYTDLWPSHSTEIIDDPNTYSNWRYKKPLNDFPVFDSEQEAPSQFFMVDQRAATNPTDGYYPRVYLGTTSIATKPPSTYLVLNKFRGIGYFPPTTDDYLVSPFGGDTYGTYNSNDLYRLGRYDFFHEGFETDYDLTSVTFFMRRTAAESAVKDKEIYLALGDEFISPNIANTSLLWSVSSAPSTLNFTVYKYQFGEEIADPFDPSDYLIDVQSNLLNQELGLVIKIEPNLAVSQCYGVIHYVFMRATYQHKEHQIIRMGGSARIKSSAYTVVPSGSIGMSGKAQIAINCKVIATGVVNIAGTYNLSKSEYVSSGGVSMSGTPTDANGVLKNSAFYYTGDLTSITMAGQAKVISTNNSYQMSGTVSLDGTAKVVRKRYKHVAKTTPVAISGIALIKWRQVSKGEAIVAGEAAVISSGYGFWPRTGVTVSGAAIVASTFLGEFSVNIGGFTDALSLDVIELVEDVVASDIVLPTIVLSKCGCVQLPLSLRYSQNLNRDNKLSQFLIKNNLTMPLKSSLEFNSINDSWQQNYHFVGKSLDYDGFDETWDIVFELACTDLIGGSFLGDNLWKWSVNIVKRNSIDDFNTRIIVAFPPNESCFTNNELNFRINIDTSLNMVELDPDLTVSQLIIYDEIGLFKNKSWIDDPVFYTRISQARLDRTVQRINLDSVLV